MTRKIFIMIAVTITAIIGFFLVRKKRNDGTPTAVSNGVLTGQITNGLSRMQNFDLPSVNDVKNAAIDFVKKNDSSFGTTNNDPKIISVVPQLSQKTEIEKANLVDIGVRGVVGVDGTNVTLPTQTLKDSTVTIDKVGQTIYVTGNKSNQVQTVQNETVFNPSKETRTFQESRTIAIDYVQPIPAVSTSPFSLPQVAAKIEDLPKRSINLAYLDSKPQQPMVTNPISVGVLNFVSPRYSPPPPKNSSVAIPPSKPIMTKNSVEELKRKTEKLAAESLSKIKRL